MQVVDQRRTLTRIYEPRCVVVCSIKLDISIRYLRDSAGRIRHTADLGATEFDDSYDGRELALHIENLYLVSVRSTTA